MLFKVAILLIVSLTVLRFVYYRHRRINLLDILVVSNVFFMGFYPAIDILKSKYDYGNDVFLVSVLYIGVNLTLLYLAFNFVSSRNQKIAIEIKSFAKHARKIPNSFLAGCFLLSVGVILYFFANYGLFSRVYSDGLPITNTYRQVIENVVKPLFILVTVGAIAKISISPSKHRLLNYFYLATITCYWLFYGRREMIFHLLIIALILFIASRRKVNVRKIPHMLLAVIFLILGSNTYLNLRSDIMGYRFNNEFNPDQSLYEIIFDFESSDENLEERHSALPLFSKIINDIRLNEDLSNGEILKSSINNVIPSAFISRPKNFVDDDIIIADQLKISRDDFNTNLYSSFYMDFGWLGLVIQPAILLIYFLLSAWLLQISSNSHLFSSLIFSEVLNTSLNIETSMTGVLSSFRLLVILIIIYFIFNRIIYRLIKAN